jgi:CcmD family protein
MNAVKFLYAAYIATWVIHGLYLASLVRRYGALQRRMKDLAGR